MEVVGETKLGTLLVVVTEPFLFQKVKEKGIKRSAVRSFCSRIYGCDFLNSLCTGILVKQSTPQIENILQQMTGWRSKASGVQLSQLRL